MLRKTRSILALLVLATVRAADVPPVSPARGNNAEAAPVKAEGLARAVNRGQDDSRVIVPDMSSLAPQVVVPHHHLPSIEQPAPRGSLPDITTQPTKSHDGGPLMPSAEQLVPPISEGKSEVIKSTELKADDAIHDRTGKMMFVVTPSGDVAATSGDKHRHTVKLHHQKVSVEVSASGAVMAQKADNGAGKPRNRQGQRWHNRADKPRGRQSRGARRIKRQNKGPQGQRTETRVVEGCPPSGCPPGTTAQGPEPDEDHDAEDDAGDVQEPTVVEGCPPSGCPPGTNAQGPDEPTEDHDAEDDAGDDDEPTVVEGCPPSGCPPGTTTQGPDEKPAVQLGDPPPGVTMAEWEAVHRRRETCHRRRRTRHRRRRIPGCDDSRRRNPVPHCPVEGSSLAQSDEDRLADTESEEVAENTGSSLAESDEDRLADSESEEVADNTESSLAETDGDRVAATRYQYRRRRRRNCPVYEEEPADAAYADGPDGTGGDDGGCFPGASLVEVPSDAGSSPLLRPIQDIRVGDMVRTPEGFERVFAVTVWLPESKRKFLQLVVRSSSKEATMELTSNHYAAIGIIGNGDAMNFELRRADAVKIGDIMPLADGDHGKVVSIALVQRTGVHNIKTPSGRFLLRVPGGGDAIVASTATDSGLPSWLQAANGLSIFDLPLQAVSHIFPSLLDAEGLIPKFVQAVENLRARYSSSRARLQSGAQSAGESLQFV